LNRKIRLQVHGEIVASEGAKPLRAIVVARQLGLAGLYKGAFPCLLRDAPFGAMYFPAFAHFKKDLFHEGYQGKQLTFWETLASASMA
jgi:solute carrier family 25 aspartate/glutamate transporter 12/13